MTLPSVTGTNNPHKQVSVNAYNALIGDVNDLKSEGGVRPEWTGAIGNGTADDGTAVAAALTAAAGSSLNALAGKSYKLTTWTGHTPLGNLTLDFRGATLTGLAAQNILSGGGYDYNALGGTFDTFLGAITNTSTTGATSDNRFWGMRFRNGESVVISLENPFDRYTVAFSRFDNNRGNQIRAGNNTYSLAAGWAGFAAIGNTFSTIRAASDANSTETVTAVISYSPGTRIIGNYVNGITAGKEAEGAYFYTKTIHGIVALNTAKGAVLTSGGSGRFYAVNLKGSVRGDTTAPQGYGAMALGNHLMASGGPPANAFVGGQMQADEQAFIANNFDGFNRAIEYSGIISGSVIGLNRGYGSAASANTGMAGNVSGSAVLNIGNVLRNYGEGISYTVVSGTTLDRLILTGGHLEGILAASSTGLALAGTGTKNVTNVQASNYTLNGFTNGVILTQVQGAILTNFQFANITNYTSAKRSLQLNSCNDVVGRNFGPVRIQTTSGSSVSAIEIGLSDGNAGCLRLRVQSRKSDGTARESIEARCPFYMESGAVTLGTATVTKEYATSINVVFSVSSGVRVRASVSGIASQTWDHWCVPEFDIL